MVPMCVQSWRSKLPTNRLYTRSKSAKLYPMKKSLCLLIALALCVAVNAQAMTKSPSGEANPSSKNTPGVELAQTLSTVTGVAISPLLGVGAVGAWKYYHTPPEKRARLPWFAQPAFWIPALVLVAIVGIK